MRGEQVLQPGGTLTLRYRVCVHPGRWDAEALCQAAARYAEEVARRQERPTPNIHL